MSDLPGIHEDYQRTHAVKRSSERGFGIVFTIVFALIGLWPLIDFEEPHFWALILAGLFLGIAMIRPALLAPLNRLWDIFGRALHRFLNPLIMGVMYFLVVTPIGLAMRLCGQDPLRLKLEANQPSYWIKRDPPGPSPEAMKDQF